MIEVMLIWWLFKPDSPLPEYLPGPHREHWSILPWLNEPGKHCTHDAAPAKEYVPGEHWTWLVPSQEHPYIIVSYGSVS